MAQIKINELPQQANTSNVSVLGVTDNGNGVLLPIEEAIATKEELATIGSKVGEVETSVATKASKTDLSSVSEQIQTLDDYVNGEKKNYTLGYIDGQGRITDSTTRVYSVLLPVKSGDTLEWKYGVTSYGFYLATYKEDGTTHVEHWGGSDTSGVRTFTPSKECSYMRASFVKSAMSDCYIKKNGIKIYYPHDDLDGKIKEIENEIDVMQQMEKSPYYKGVFACRKSALGEYYKSIVQNPCTQFGFGQTKTASTGATISSYTYTQVLSVMETLRSGSNGYVTRKQLGTASGTDADGNAYTMWEYVFTPRKLNKGNPTRKTAKILIETCIHGFEKTSFFGWFVFLWDLVNNFSNNVSLSEIRQSVEIHFIPVVNPYGFDNNIYKNGSDPKVNINRNFDTDGWYSIEDVTSKDYNGLAPFDQPESAIIRDWVDANNDALLFIDAHTNGSTPVSSYVTANSCMTNFGDDVYYDRLSYAINKHIEMQSVIAPTMYASLNPPTWLGNYQENGQNPGQTSKWIREKKNMLGMTLEGNNGINYQEQSVMLPFTDENIKLNAEMFGNMLMQVLEEYSE